MRFEGGSASSSGRPFSCILLGRLKPIPYTPFSSSGRLVRVRERGGGGGGGGGGGRRERQRERKRSVVVMDTCELAKHVTHRRSSSKLLTE